jgi:hypothetical protein
VFPALRQTVRDRLKADAVASLAIGNAFRH